MPEPSINTFQHLMDRLYRAGQPEPRGCYPRDIITTIIDEAEFEDKKPSFDIASIDLAVGLYLGVETEQTDAA